LLIKKKAGNWREPSDAKTLDNKSQPSQKRNFPAKGKKNVPGKKNLPEKP